MFSFLTGISDQLLRDTKAGVRHIVSRLSCVVRGCDAYFFIGSRWIRCLQVCVASSADCVVPRDYFLYVEEETPSKDIAAHQQARTAMVVQAHLSALVIHVKAPSVIIILVGDLKAVRMIDLLRLKLGI